MKAIRAGIAVGGLFLASAALADFVPPSTYSPTLLGGKQTSDKAYAGLRWDVPGPIAPSLVLGIRHARVESDGDIAGGDASFSLSLAAGARPGQLRVKGFTGKPDYQWELGGGYDLGAKGFFVGPGINFPYLNLQMDWHPNPGLKPYVMIQTLGKYKNPDGTPICNLGDFYNPVTGLCETGGGGPE